MISAFSITNFILIDRLDIDASEGFTGLTGQTGAGKSILLEALDVAFGGRPEKRFVRAGCERAIVAIEVSVLPDHAIWALLEEQGVAIDRGDVLIFKRIVPRSGSARGFVNDQPVSAGVLRLAGELLVEIHAQHAASSLLKVSRHRDYLDQYAGNVGLVEACRRKWQALEVARSKREQFELEVEKARSEEVWLCESLEDLEQLQPQRGEASDIAQRRKTLMEADRIVTCISDVRAALSGGAVEDALGRVCALLGRLSNVPALATEGGIGASIRDSADAYERVMIELSEANQRLLDLSQKVDMDADHLEALENRLFLLRGAGRRYGVDPDRLDEYRDTVAERVAMIESDHEASKVLLAEERDAAAEWHSASTELTVARSAAARALEEAIAAELAPLKLERMQIRIDVSPLEDAERGANGCDRVEIQIEPNPGHGFGPLKKIASGGELSRVSLALKCALAGAGSMSTLIFDEADQGVGGAVAAAIGERLLRLSRERQVFAITHSPQVAAACEVQWQIDKGEDAKGLGRTSVTVLDEAARREEIARMLSGAAVTSEARAAAAQLLEEL